MEANYNILVVLPYTDMNQPWCTCVPHPEPPPTSLPVPSPWVIPVDQPQASCILQKTLDSPLDCKEIKPVTSKENQPRIFIGRTDVEAEAPILSPFDVKTRLTERDPDAGKDCRQEEKGTTKGEMAGWHHRLIGREFG